MGIKTKKCNYFELKDAKDGTWIAAMVNEYSDKKNIVQVGNRLYFKVKSSGYEQFMSDYVNLFTHEYVLSAKL